MFVFVFLFFSSVFVFFFFFFLLFFFSFFLLFFFFSFFLFGFACLFVFYLIPHTLHDEHTPAQTTHHFSAILKAPHTNQAFLFMSHPFINGWINGLSVSSACFLVWYLLACCFKVDWMRGLPQSPGTNVVCHSRDTSK